MLTDEQKISKEIFERARAEVLSWPSWKLSYDVRAELQRLGVQLTK